MTARAYPLLFAVMVGAGVVVSLIVRAPRRDTARPAATTAAAPAVDLALRIDGAAVTPAASSVPKGSRVRLAVTNVSAHRLTVALAGYEDRVRTDSLAAGSTWRVEFLADRPGDDFAWIVDGEPRGRFVTAGSHLVEGHR